MYLYASSGESEKEVETGARQPGVGYREKGGGFWKMKRNRRSAGTQFIKICHRLLPPPSPPGLGDGKEVRRKRVPGVPCISVAQ